MKATEELPRLKAANLARATFDRLFTERGEGEPWTAEDKAAIDAYLAAFVEPASGGKCVCCGTVQGGLMAVFAGGFQWGLQNGEGHCTTCGWPARALHRNVGGGLDFQLILQYHPDNLTEGSS